MTGVMIATIFSDPGWRWSTGFPNRVYGNGEIGAVVVVQGKPGADFALSVAALDYVLAAEAEGRIAEGYVVFATRNGSGNPEFFAAERVKTVAERLEGVDPRSGEWGDYHWLGGNFAPAAKSRAEMPF